MADTLAVDFRRADERDLQASYGVFRRSLADYLQRIGQGDPGMADESSIAAALVRQRPWMDHLIATAAEHWVAVDGAGAVVGWALSVERGPMLELALFFVEPTAQARGIGRGLLQRALPASHSGHRAIVATLDPRALGLYLQSGVAYRGIAADFIVRPRSAPVATDLDLAPLTLDDESLATIVDVERVVIGHGRPIDHRFLAAQRPAWIARRGGRPVGFAYGVAPDGYAGGPVAAFEPSDLPALLTAVENGAANSNIEEFALTVPLMARAAVDHLIARGARIDPFYVAILTDEPWLQVDRWIITGPGFLL